MEHKHTHHKHHYEYDFVDLREKYDPELLKRYYDELMVPNFGVSLFSRVIQAGLPAYLFMCFIFQYAISLFLLSPSFPH
jgi:hypothetical protein